jgi:hypothetical protein|tara:strand:+ start:250 stop:915 length:666 start_codon:yes stop_codon:yes gene_type:complete
MENKEIKKQQPIKQASRRKYHIIYKTTCLITNRFYVGMHSTDNLEDGYIGSGKLLWRSVNKHGKENHATEILETLPDRSSLKEREKHIVNEKFLKDKMCMNLAIGGNGGAGTMTKEQLSKGAVNANKVKWSNPEFRSKMSLMTSERNKELHAKGIMKAPDWTGKKHSVETILKMKASKKGHGTGSTNSQFGKCWITNEIESKRIMKGDQIPEGWRLGRNIK